MKRQKKILVIDDSEVALAWAQLQLLSAGYDVVVNNAPVGSSILTVKEQPDLVLVDVSMPTLQGDDVVKMLRGYVSLHNASLILYSDRDEAELARLVEESGADGYLQKTGDPKRFLNAIRNFLDLRGI